MTTTTTKTETHKLTGPAVFVPECPETGTLQHMRAECSCGFVASTTLGASVTPFGGRSGHFAEGEVAEHAAWMRAHGR